MTNKTISIKNIIITLSPSFLRRYFERIESSPIGYRLAKGAFWSLAGALISRGLALLSSIIVARILGKEGFGELGIIQSTVGMFGVFAGFGLGMTATKYVAEFREKNPQKAGRIIALSNIVAIISGGIMAIILIILSPWLASNTLAAPHLREYLQIGAVLLFLSVLTAVQTGVLSGFEAFKTIAKVNFWAGIASFILIVIGVYIVGLRGAVWGAIAGMGINWFLNKIALQSEANKANLQIDFNNCRQEWRVLWNFSLPLFLSTAMTGPITWLCNALLVNQNNGYAEMGIFNAANSFRTLLIFLPSIFLQAAFPMLSANYEAYKNNPQFEQILAFTHNSINLPLVLVCIFIMTFPNLFMMLYGCDFAKYPTVLIGLMMCTIIQGLGTTVGSTIQIKGDVWFGFILNLVWGGLLLTLVYFTASFLKATALSFSYAISYIVLLLLQMWRLRNDLPNQLKLSILKTLFLTIITTAILILLTEYEIPILKVIFLIIVSITLLKCPIIKVNPNLKAKL